MNSKRDHNRQRIDLTENQLLRIKDLSISGRRLETELGISAEKINKTRQALGLSFRRGNFKKEMKADRSKKVYKKPLNKRESIFDSEHRLKEEGKKMHNSNSEIEKEKLANGYKWYTMVGRYGIKETKLIKI